MLKRLFLPFCFLVTFSDAYFLTTNNLNGSNKILKNFDIDAVYLKNSMSISSQYLQSRYSTAHFLKVLRDGQDIIPMLRSMLKERGVPEIFLYLAMAESNFSLHAKSRSKAVGLWQFVQQTGRVFGLRIDAYVDERKDPIKSTKAAIEYLKYLHGRFGKWYVAAMAYNCGEARVRKAIRNAQSDDIAVLLDEDKKYVPKETRRYISKIIAMATVLLDEQFIIENDADYLLNQGQHPILEEVKVPAGTSLESIGSSIGVSVDKMRTFNSHLKYSFTPPDGKKYHVYLPYGTKGVFEKRFVPDKSIKRHKGFKYHMVKKGDSLYFIAKKHHVSVSLLKEFNNFKRKYLKIGQKIIVPSMESFEITQSNKVKKLKREYIVKKGDTLGAISLRFKVKLSDIRAVNKKKNSFIKPGEKIVIPSK